MKESDERDFEIKHNEFVIHRTLSFSTNVNVSPAEEICLGHMPAVHGPLFLIFESKLSLQYLNVSFPPCCGEGYTNLS